MLKCSSAAQEHSATQGPWILPKITFFGRMATLRYEALQTLSAAGHGGLASIQRSEFYKIRAAQITDCTMNQFVGQHALAADPYLLMS